MYQIFKSNFFSRSASPMSFVFQNEIRTPCSDITNFLRKISGLLSKDGLHGSMQTIKPKLFSPFQRRIMWCIYAVVPFSRTVFLMLVVWNSKRKKMFEICPSSLSLHSSRRSFRASSIRFEHYKDSIQTFEIIFAGHGASFISRRIFENIDHFHEK